MAGRAIPKHLSRRKCIIIPHELGEASFFAVDSKFAILGGGSIVPIGTFAEYVAVERDQVIPTPDHLDDQHAAAWPLGGVTAWRSVLQIVRRGTCAEC